MRRQKVRGSVSCDRLAPFSRIPATVVVARNLTQYPRYNPPQSETVTKGQMTVSAADSELSPPPDWDSAVTVDARGLPCPQPLLAMRRALGDYAAGTLLQVLATDESSWRDFHSFAELSGKPLLRAERRGDCFYYWLRAGK